MAQQPPSLWDHLSCPICLSPFNEPYVIRLCQHTFCRAFNESHSINEACYYAFDTPTSLSGVDSFSPPLPSFHLSVPSPSPRDCISASLLSKPSCPVCRIAASATSLAPNRFVANILNDNKLFINTAASGQTTTILRLSITERYAPKWQPRQGIREIVQNWYDGVNEQIAELRSSHENLLEAPAPAKSVFQHTTHVVDEQTIDKYTCKHDEKIYGEIEYNHFTRILSLTNRDVSLSRKILLLGSSTKVDKEYLVGQFGEGLKIGILALVREGRAVTMHTNSEHWTFGLQHDAQYGEKVLSVTVERDAKPLSSHDTTTNVYEITPDEWKVFSQDFLFLEPPREFCETINGTLLLDATHKHKLFVKGFWICDLQESGLTFGVNLNQMELDRDRRAVVQKHDIENKVADIWTKSIVVRQDLVPIFFDLLMMNDEMISKAQWYITDCGIDLVSKFFISTQGENAQPVRNTNKDDVLLVENVLKKKAVLCPEPLYNILTKSTHIRPLEEELSSYASSSVQVVPLGTLTVEERSVLESVFDLLRTVIDPSVFSSRIFSSNFGTSGTMADFGRWKNNVAQISRKIFDGQSVHEVFNRCTSASNGVKSAQEKCRCVETYVLLVLVSLRSQATTTNFQMRQGMEKVTMERLLEKLIGMHLK